MSVHQHLEVRSTDEGVLLIVDDYELFDFLDDHLTQIELEFEFMSRERRNGREFYKMHFPAGMSLKNLNLALQEIPASEIQRIWDLNNP